MEIRTNYELSFTSSKRCQNFYMISANADLVMESKARWDAGGKELYGQKVVGTGFEFVERKVGSHVLYKRVELLAPDTSVQRKFRWVPEGVTRLATLMAGGAHRRYRPRPAGEMP